KRLAARRSHGLTQAGVVIRRWHRYRRGQLGEREDRSMESKVADVTGASSGIARAIAERFLDDGYRIVVMARTEEALQEMKARAPDKVVVVLGNVTDASDLNRLVDAAVSAYKSVDVVIPNAG